MTARVSTTIAALLLAPAALATDFTAYEQAVPGSVQSIAMVPVSGGGYIMGSPEQAVEIIGKFIDTRPCVVIAPDYRKSFTAPFPASWLPSSNRSGPP